MEFARLIVSSQRVTEVYPHALQRCRMGGSGGVASSSIGHGEIRVLEACDAASKTISRRQGFTSEHLTSSRQTNILKVHLMLSPESHCPVFIELSSYRCMFEQSSSIELCRQGVRGSTSTQKQEFVNWSCEVMSQTIPTTLPNYTLHQDHPTLM
jgi:hypothetical protein